MFIFKTINLDPGMVYILGLAFLYIHALGEFIGPSCQNLTDP